MTADLISYLNTRLSPVVDLGTSVRIAGLVRTVEKTEGKKVSKFPMPVDENDTEPVLPDSKLGLLLYWDQRSRTTTVDAADTRTAFRSNVRLVAWYNTRFVNAHPDQVKIALVRHLLHYLGGSLTGNLPDGVQALKLKSGDIVERRNELFGEYTYNNDAAQYMTLPYDAVGIDFTLSWWLNHACLPELYGSSVSGCP